MWLKLELSNFRRTVKKPSILLIFCRYISLHAKYPMHRIRGVISWSKKDLCLLIFLKSTESKYWMKTKKILTSDTWTRDPLPIEIKKFETASSIQDSSSPTASHPRLQFDHLHYMHLWARKHYCTKKAKFSTVLFRAKDGAGSQR